MMFKAIHGTEGLCGLGCNLGLTDALFEMTGNRDRMTFPALHM